MLPFNSDTSYLVSRLLYEPHIYAGQEDRMKDVWWAHRFFDEIETGQRIVFGVFSENTLTGCVHGTLEGDCFVAHTMFRRKVDAVKCSLIFAELLKNYCYTHDIPLRAIVGYPPEDSRVAVYMNKRFGCKDMGIAENVKFYRNGKLIPCRYMRKEI